MNLKTIFLFITLAFATTPKAAEVVVYTTEAHPVNHAENATVYYLDRSDKLNAKLSHGLPADPEAAKTIVLNFLKTPEGQQLLKEMQQAVEVETRAAMLGIKRVPAVVVDNQKVIYGVSNVAEAVSRLQVEEK